MTLVPTSTDVRSQDLSADLQGHKDDFEASQEGKWWCQAIRDPESIIHKSSGGETEPPLLSSHRSNDCSSAGMASFLQHERSSESPSHRRQRWMEREATGERKVRWKELVRSAAHSLQMSHSPTVKLVDWP